jgi:hypothetical protein
MDSKSASSVPARPGQGGFATASHGAVPGDMRDSLPGSTLPPAVSVRTLDNVRCVFWQAYRHLFPPHSLAAQTRNGSLVISWSVMDDPHAHYPYATPVLLRFDADLLEAMAQADARTRIRIALTHEPTLREGLRGYNPYARFPNARVITMG